MGVSLLFFLKTVGEVLNDKTTFEQRGAARGLHSIQYFEIRAYSGKIGSVFLGKVCKYLNGQNIKKLSWANTIWPWTECGTRMVIFQSPPL